MKLCRFELVDDPGSARSGIYHEERVYEVDGRNARGIHDLGRVRFLAPVQRPVSIRMFENTPTGLRFEYLNPGALRGSGAEIDVSEPRLSIEVRLGVVIQETGHRYAIDEAEQAVLGLTACLTFRRDHPDPVVARDLPLVVAPFLTTPNELPPADLYGRRSFLIEARREDRDPMTFEVRETTPIPVLVSVASASFELCPGDLLLSPPLVVSGPQTGFPSISAGDRIIVCAGELGAVACGMI